MNTGKWLFILFLCVSFSTQGSITFQVETLSKPTKLLPVMDQKKALHQVISTTKKDAFDKDNLISQNKCADSLVNFGSHSFFEGMYKAYSDHRPFVLSPDMIWILISQGFSQHVNNNAESLRHYFVKHEGKMTLEVISNEIRLDDPNSPWEKMFPVFAKQIDNVVGKDLVNTLTCDFTTTTPVSKIASQITVMEAMQSYFEYILTYMSCGIPQITLEGEPEDWQKIIDKTKSLSGYELSWWTDRLIPTLEEIKKTSQGQVDTTFWQSMFIRPKKNEFRMCSPTDIDGWIVSFFPYNKSGKRNSLNKLTSSADLPTELSCVDLVYFEKTVTGNITRSEMLELWSGFVGLTQNPKDYTLKPEIGWMIRIKDASQDAMLKALDVGINSGSDYFRMGVDNISEEFITKLLNYQKKVQTELTLEFTFSSNIIIPKRFGEIKLQRLRLNGQIEASEIERLMELLKNTKELTINGNVYKKMR